MKSDHFRFEKVDRSFLRNFYTPRVGETRIGDLIQTACTADTKFCILGIEESIGPQKNGGLPGAENAFKSFLLRFLNMQANRHITADEVCLMGRISCHNGVAMDLPSLVEELDSFVLETLKKAHHEQATLIVIGGGHNNAYPIVRYFEEQTKKISVLNVDPHADCRALEGRHSGNPFSYAISENRIHSYSVIGLHKAYNNESILNFLDQHKCYYSFFDDHLLDMCTEFDRVITNFDPQGIAGIELDMDAIAFSPSSAFTPSGLRFEEARYFIAKCAKHLSPVYLHLPEAAPNNEQEERISGKMLAYLVHDFIIHHSSMRKIE
jgi:formiminoglutamase